MELLRREYKKELDMLEVALPDVSRIPSVRFDRAKELVSEKYSRKIKKSLRSGARGGAAYRQVF